MKKIYLYEDTYNKNYWSKYLGRKLSDEEDSLLDAVKKENDINRRIECIAKYIYEKNLYVFDMPKLDGNCLFESIVQLGLADNSQKLRSVVSTIMLTFRDFPNFIPNNNSTLFEIFTTLMADVDFVYCNETQKLYNYNYDIMCHDICDKGSWTRLPTQLVLIVLSFALNIKFNIYRVYDKNGISHARNFESGILDINLNEISTIDNEKTTTVHLGLINDFHYFPLKYSHDKKTKPCIFNSANLEFKHWADTMADSLGKYELIDDHHQKHISKENKTIEFTKIGIDCNSDDLVNFS